MAQALFRRRLTSSHHGESCESSLSQWQLDAEILATIALVMGILYMFRTTLGPPALPCCTPLYIADLCTLYAQGLIVLHSLPPSTALLCKGLTLKSSPP